MLAGEAQQLISGRATAFGAGYSRKVYKFQIRSDDGLDHFRNISHSQPALRLVLAYGYDDHSYGSYFIARGRARSYSAPSRLVENVMAKHGVGHNPDEEWPYDSEMDAETELMDLVEARWHKLLLRGHGQSQQSLHST